MNALSNVINASALLPIKGCAYAPSPSDDTLPPTPSKNFDSDFTNSHFTLWWSSFGGGRGDLFNLARNVGINFLHLYNWSIPPAEGHNPDPYQRNHDLFLSECTSYGIKVFIPISEWFLEQIHQGNSKVEGCFDEMVQEIYPSLIFPFPLPAAGIWGIGNGYDLADPERYNIDDVVIAIKYLIQAEDTLKIPAPQRLPITSPVSIAACNNLPSAIDPIQRLQTAFQKQGMEFVWEQRFIASINPFIEGKDLCN